MKTELVCGVGAQFCADLHESRQVLEEHGAWVLGGFARTNGHEYLLVFFESLHETGALSLYGDKLGVEGTSPSKRRERKIRIALHESLHVHARTSTKTILVSSRTTQSSGKTGATPQSKRTSTRLQSHRDSPSPLLANIVLKEEKRMH